MVTTIKRGTTRDRVIILLNQIKSRKPRKISDIRKYCGALNLKEDPILLQKKWRDEW